MEAWVVYILFSESLNRHYIGCTKDFSSRIEKHQLKAYGSNAFTAKAADWQVKLKLHCIDEAHAKRIERHIKKMKSRVYIDNLARYPEMQQKLLYSI